MALKKSQLYSSLWESCDALRGSMDASQYKDYVLMVLFVKYLSDKAKQGEELLSIPEGCYFDDFTKLKYDSNIGEEINKKLEKIKEENIGYIGSIQLPNFNDSNKFGEGKQMVNTLSKLIAVFEKDELDFSKNRSADDDLLGDAYEYLMKNFAVESGKSKGQFYTPAEVSRVIAKVLNLKEFSRKNTTIYDPTCGSGSLLLRAMSETEKGRASLFGQEKDNATSTLALLNMFLHGVNDATIYAGKDTLINPQNVEAGMLQTFDVCVANPPFSQKNWFATDDKGNPDVNDIYHRWTPSRMPPAKCGDYAFLLHLIYSMNPETGRGACILPHGVLFRGNAEYEIRKYLVDLHIIKGIIGLPANIFYGTGIPASIIILDNKDKSLRSGIFFIDAKDGYMKDGAKNRLREQDIRRIVDVWNQGQDVPHYARFVSLDEIKQNDYNLNIPRYIQPEDTEIVQDINAHLNGGMPKHDIDLMQTVWDVCDTLKDALFESKNGNFYLIPQKEDIAATIQNDESFRRQSDMFQKSLHQWTEQTIPLMYAVDKDSKPKKLISQWSDSILEIAKADASLVSPYEVYDHLMNYWNETMQDDCYMISNDGWKTPEDILPQKSNGIYKDIKCSLLPVDILLKEFFAAETSAIDEVQAHLDDINAQIQSLEEETKDDDDETQEAKKADKKTLKKLQDDKKTSQRKLKALQVELTTKVIKKYQSLPISELKTLVVEKKWIASVLERCDNEMQRITQDISSKITALCTRYARPLPEIEAEVQQYENLVSQHLRDMGYEV